ncbi:Transposon Ty3-I Gag-Pol polyprotein [Vitis vinifera]|uniref:Transposon Ty3-I Gag-Pol polyprotein n=1 Tax=Vitis vinifera TaxID=29760 RepID=A0A438ITX9_VITVI|nr:Transposon Ty3-I Gag-Pol polyprotein [Vitis vinifera]
MVSARFRRHLRRAAKSLRNKKLNSQGYEIGFHLEVLSFQLAAYIGPDQDGQRQGAGYYGVVSPYQSDGIAVLPWLGQLLQKCQMTFESLKEAISTKLVLRLPDLDLPFEVQTDASDRALGGVLVQEGHPVAFESRKLNNAEQRYSTSREGDDCCGSLPTSVEALLAGEYLYGGHGQWRHNTVADALSKREVIAYITALSEVISDFNEKIKQATEQDAAYGRLKQQVKEGVIRRYWLEDELLMAKGGRWYVPAGGLRKELLRETHDAKWTGHPREERTLALLARSYYWPKMGEDVQAYVKSCLVCQMDKTERKKAVGLLQPLPIPEKPWETFPWTSSLDFQRFTGKFWVELFKLLGLELKFSTANHPQTDGQTERINVLLEEYLRHYVTATQKNWVDLMDTAHLCYNLQRNLATRMSPFELAIGVQPRMPLEVAKQKAGGNSPVAYKMAQSRQEMLDEARDSLRRQPDA